MDGKDRQILRELQGDGRLTNQDLLMLSPLLRVEGTGWVNLAEQTLDYRLRPRAVASIQGQGGSNDLQGITVPIRFRGGFNGISFGVDTEAVAQAMLRGALSNALGGQSNQRPEDVARDALLDAIGLGGTRDSETTGTQEEEVDPAQQLLQGLLNQRRNRNNPPQQAEETPPDDTPNR